MALTKSPTSGICYNCGKPADQHVGFSHHCPDIQWKGGTGFFKTAYQDAGDTEYALTAITYHDLLVEALNNILKPQSIANDAFYRKEATELLQQIKQRTE